MRLIWCSLIILIMQSYIGQCDTLYVETPVIYGCTQPVSCNYNDQATVDDGSCLTCNTPYEVGALLCDQYHGIDGIWDWWIELKGCDMEIPVPSCDTVYVTLFDTILVELYDTSYITLPPDTVYVMLPGDTTYIVGRPEVVHVQQVRECDCEYYWHIPNAFTPDDNGLNELFCPVTDTTCWEGLELSIYDRWGELVFIGDVLEGQCWDGSHAAQGIYAWKVVGRFKDLWKEERGHVTLIR